MEAGAEAREDGGNTVAEGGAVSRGDSEAEGNDCADVARNLLRLLPMIKIQLEMTFRYE